MVVSNISQVSHGHTHSVFKWKVYKKWAQTIIYLIYFTAVHDCNILIQDSMQAELNHVIGLPKVQSVVAISYVQYHNPDRIEDI